MNTIVRAFILFPFIMFYLTIPLEATLPEYIPVNRVDCSRDDLIVSYFNLGLNYSEIIGFLLLYHGIKISLRHLKRILREKDLRRRTFNSPIKDVIDAVEEELAGSGCSIGYRLMHQRLQLNRGLVVSRETVRRIVKGLDPEGVECRSKRKLRRRKYFARGPNFIWHVDGYDKLKPYGFCIHGSIDGFSRRIMWLEVGPSNNNPRITAQYFIDCIRQVGGVPRIVRGDCGTENIYIAAIQRFLRKNCTDSFGGTKSFLYGKSVANQRIESWWATLRKTSTDWWMKFFKDMRDQGLYSQSDPIQVNCLQFCFMEIIQEELNQVAKSWNLHKIRPSSNVDSPCGRPDVLYFLPDTANKSDFKTEIEEGDVVVAEEECGEVRPPMGCLPAFVELGQMIMQEHNLQMPSNPQEAKELYLELLFHINDI